MAVTINNQISPTNADDVATFDSIFANFEAQVSSDLGDDVQIAGSGEKQTLNTLASGEATAGNAPDLSDLLSSCADEAPVDPAEAERLFDRAHKLASEGDILEANKNKLLAQKELISKQIVTAKKSGADTSLLQGKLDKIDADLNLIQEFFSELANEKNLVMQADAAGFFDGASNKEEVQQFLGQQSTTANKSTFKADSAPTDASAIITNDSTTSTDSLAYDEIVSSIQDDMASSASDTVSQAQTKQQQMMTFLYYARQAMTGDMNAMYQFVQYIGIIVEKKKALQTVWMGSKLVDLQQQSTAATEELINTEVGNDVASQTNFEKAVQKDKSEEDTIAESQKLINGMMEEFAQINEMMNNLAKSLLDSAKKVTDNLSVFR